MAATARCYRTDAPPLAAGHFVVIYSLFFFFYLVLEAAQWDE